MEKSPSSEAPSVNISMVCALHIDHAAKQQQATHGCDGAPQRLSVPCGLQPASKTLKPTVTTPGQVARLKTVACGM